MTTHPVMTGHVTALLALPDAVNTAAAVAAAANLPGGWALAPPSAERSARSTDVEVTIDATAGITAEAETVRVRLPAPVANSATLAYVTYTALERARQRQRKATVHATALRTLGGRVLLLLGSKGAGKTSTALALAERGWTHAGDDLVVLGETNDGTVSVWPGKPSAAVRDPARPLAPKLQRPLTPFAAAAAPLAWVLRLAIHPALATATLTAAVPLSANEKLRLHELLARYISGLPTPVGGVDAVPYGPVWPLDAPALAHWRSHLITRLAGCRFDYLTAPCPQTAADLLTEKADTG